MKYRVVTYFNSKKISEGYMEVGLLQFPRKCGNTNTDEGFSIKYEALNTKQNRKEQEDFLKRYPTPDSL